MTPRLALRASWYLALITGLLCVLCSCTEQPIVIGFAGELTGKQSDLGIHGRNGVQLAIDTINEAGGINGRDMTLVVEDDLGTPEGAQAAATKLIEANPVAIIGHMTSSQTVAAYPITEAAGMILFSPAATTPELNRIDDHFFRVAPTHILQAETFAHYLYEQRGLRRLAGIYDTDNDAYSVSYWQNTAQIFASLGGEIVSDIPYSATKEPDFKQLLAEQEQTPDGLLIIASALDTALIAQAAYSLQGSMALFTSAWAQTDTLIQNGGSAVDGMEIIIGFDVNSQKPSYQDFSRRYKARFGYAPTFAAGEAYETMMLLADALTRAHGKTQDLRDALKNTKNFAGLIGSISLDDYGDVRRTLFLVRIENEQFVTKAALEMED